MRAWSALLLYAVSLAGFIFQFILAMGYSDLLYYAQMFMHATLWAITYCLARRVARPIAFSALLSVIAASLISLAPVDLMMHSLLNYPAEVWSSLGVRFIIHLACLVAMVLIVRRAESST